MKKIAILGCGITGMMSSLAFAHKNIPTIIIERTTSDKHPLDIRTTTFTESTKSFLEEIGIWKLFEKDSGFVRDIYVVDNKSPHMLHLESEYNKPKGFVLENMMLKEKLYRAVQQNPLIELKKGIDYSDLEEEDGQIIISKKDKIYADIVLACDGRGGNIKDKFEAKFEKSYNQCAIVFECRHELAHEGVAVEHFMPKGPFASLPMKDPHHSSIIWTEPLELKDTFLKMDKDMLNQLFSEKMGEFLGKVEIASEVQAFPLTARITKRYYQGNLLLVGDSAHAIHPLAGQGLNQGVKDIQVLADIFAKRINHGLEINEIAYQEYENSRKLDNKAVFLMTDNINRIFSNEFFPLTIFRKIGLAAINESKTLRKLVSSGNTVF